MGNWHISIKGVGIHHNNNNPGDADKIALETVKQLRKAGHTIVHADITYGAAQTLLLADPSHDPGGDKG